MRENHVSPYVAEMPVAGLKTAELFLLTTIRLWLSAQRNPRAVVADWRQGLAAARLAEDGAPDFDMTLRILSAAAKPALASRDAGHPSLSADEARLLQLFGALQRGETGDAVLSLQTWMPTKPLRWLLRYARSFVGLMATQKLILPDSMPEDQPRLRYARAPVRSSTPVLSVALSLEFQIQRGGRRCVLHAQFSESPTAERKTIFIFAE